MGVSTLLIFYCICGFFDLIVGAGSGANKGVLSDLSAGYYHSWRYGSVPPASTSRLRAFANG